MLPWEAVRLIVRQVVLPNSPGTWSVHPNMLNIKFPCTHVSTNWRESETNVLVQHFFYLSKVGECITNVHFRQAMQTCHTCRQNFLTNGYLHAKGNNVLSEIHNFCGNFAIFLVECGMSAWLVQRWTLVIAAVFVYLVIRDKTNKYLRYASDISLNNVLDDTFSSAVIIQNICMLAVGVTLSQYVNFKTIKF